jgi:hypothetical protein
MRHLIALVGLVLGTSSAVAEQKLDTLPLNSAVSGWVEFGDKQFFLPDGEWILVATGKWNSAIGTTQRGAPMGGAVLLQTRAKQLSRLVYILTNLEQQRFNNSWIEDPCKRGNVFAKSDWSRNPFDQYCMMVNHYVGVMSSSSGWSRSAAVWIEENKVTVPRTMVAVDFHRVEQSNLVNLRYYFNPELDGISSSGDRNWANSEWQRDVMVKDPGRLAYAEQLKTWAEGMRPFVLAGIEGKRKLGGSPPTAPFPKDRAGR